jgi:hypothetical protein
MVILVMGAFAAHTHDQTAAEDCYLCACSTCPAPGAVTLAFDQPRPASWNSASVQLSPLAPPAAAPVLRRGPPVSVA